MGANRLRSWKISDINYLNKLIVFKQVNHSFKQVNHSVYKCVE
mgnify:CR=1 FL=1